MGVEYGPAIDMFVNQAGIYPNALVNVPDSDLSIVIHKTACNAPCSAQSTGQYFVNASQQPPYGPSTHFIVGLDGVVVQCVHLGDGAGGNCCLEPGHDTYWNNFIAKYPNLNWCTISIEHIDQTIDNSQPMTQAQVGASHLLVAFLCRTFHIPNSRIKGHNTLDPINRARCPGPTYDFQSLFIYLDSLGGEMFSNELCIAVWNSFFISQGGVIPRRDTGIFNSWRSLWMGGHFKGCVLTDEYPVTLPNGDPGVAQNFAGGTCVWDNVTSTPTWL